VTHTNNASLTPQAYNSLPGHKIEEECFTDNIACLSLIGVVVIT